MHLSIILSCYNTDKFIGKTIQSIIDQNYSKWELIIINDGSTDNSLNEIIQFEQLDNRIKVYSVQNGGVNKARNYGYTKVNSQSKYIHFMDSDDILNIDFYSKLVLFLENNNDFGAVYCDHIFINENDQEIIKPNWGKRFVPTRFGLMELPDNKIETPFICIALWCKMVEPMVILRRTEFEKSRKWDETFKFGRIGEGVVLFSEISWNSKIGYINDKLFLYRRHKNQSSQHKKVNFDSFSITTDKLISLLNNKCKKFLFICSVNRFKAITEIPKLKHSLRYDQKQFIKSLLKFVWFYIQSFPIFFYKSSN